MKILIVSLITLSRPVLAYCSVQLFFQRNWFFAWLLFLFCVLTDVVDGVLARYWKVITEFGAKIDLLCDILIFWIFIPGVYLYSQKYSPWSQQWLTPQTLAVLILLLAIILTAIIIGTVIGKNFLRWYTKKGNFWFGVIPVALIGLWLAVNVAWWAAAISLIYGLFACWLNWKKILKFV